jgi:U4/U6.U5 tri-snRNP component SNU23
MKKSTSAVTGRRTWDKAFLEKKNEQQKKEEDEYEKNERERAKKAKQPQENDQFAPTRSWLERRDYQLDFEKRVGKATVVSSLRDKNSGFYCEICKVLQKDSNAYLNHLNSRIHQKNLGMSLRVERVDAKSVEDRIEKLSRHNNGEAQQDVPTNSSATTNLKKTKENKQLDNNNNNTWTNEDDEDDEYKSMAETMGLPLSFSSTKQK